MDKICFSFGETSEILGIHRNTLMRILRDRKLSTVLVGRRRKIPATEIDRYIKDNTVPYKLIHYKKTA